MKRFWTTICLFLALLTTALAALPDPFIGDYRGEWLDRPTDFLKNSPQITAQVISLGDELYRIRFLSEYERRSTPIFIVMGFGRDGVISIKESNFNCRVEDGVISGEGMYHSKEPVRFRLERFTRISKTMGRPAPAGAVVLYDGGSLGAWQHFVDGESIDPVWESDDGILRVLPRNKNDGVGGDLVSRGNFKSCELHIEFRLPYEPENRGQGRANSGVFLQGVYEVQILDSYGLVGDWSECGALYKVAPPKVNRCSPPGQWQTYDIVFDAAEYDEDGNLVRNPVITVLHNGELIHNQQELFERTQYYQTNRLEPPPADPGPIVLQDHGHPIEFRNIWLVER